MSMENAMKFVADVAMDDSMKEKVAGVKDDFKTLAEIAKKNGYDVTAEEIETVAKSLAEKLDDSDLDSVAGGTIVDRGMDILEWGSTLVDKYPVLRKIGEAELSMGAGIASACTTVAKGFCSAIKW